MVAGTPTSIGLFYSARAGKSPQTEYLETYFRGWGGEGSPRDLYVQGLNIRLPENRAEDSGLDALSLDDMLKLRAPLGTQGYSLILLDGLSNIASELQIHRDKGYHTPSDRRGRNADYVVFSQKEDDETGEVPVEILRNGKEPRTDENYPSVEQFLQDEYNV